MVLTSVTMVGWADVPDSDWGDFRRWRAVDISSYLVLNNRQVITWTSVNEIQQCNMLSLGHSELTLCGRVTHYCDIGLGNGLVNDKHQTIASTNIVTYHQGSHCLPDSNFTGITQEMNSENDFGRYTFALRVTFSMGKWINSLWSVDTLWCWRLLVNTGSDNHLLPDSIMSGTKLLTLLTLITKTSLKSTDVNVHSNLQGANKFDIYIYIYIYIYLCID